MTDSGSAAARRLPKVMILGAGALFAGLCLAILVARLRSTPGTSADLGRDVYGHVCTSCHGTGLAGAPLAGDKTAWAPRIAQGKPVLYEHALKGFIGHNGVMPARGGWTCRMRRSSRLSTTWSRSSIETLSGLIRWRRAQRLRESTAQLDRFGDVLRADVLAPLQIRDRPAQGQQAMHAASG